MNTFEEELSHMPGDIVRAVQYAVEAAEVTWSDDVSGSGGAECLVAGVTFTTPARAALQKVVRNECDFDWVRRAATAETGRLLMAGSGIGPARAAVELGDRIENLVPRGREFRGGPDGAPQW